MGVTDGVILRMAGKGNKSATGGKEGDLLLKVSVRPHPYYKRFGNDIKTDRYISVT